MNHLARNSVVLLIVSSVLSGCASGLAAGAVGGVSSIADRRTAATNAGDTRLDYRVNQIIKAQLPMAHVNSESFNQVVLLTGEVPNSFQGQQAENLARTVPGVRNVVNELAVGNPSSMASRAADTIITGKVKAAFVADSMLQLRAFVVTTERGNVYLQGSVTQAEGLRAAEVAKTVGGVRQVVKLFAYLNDDQFKQTLR
jgi:osmotically-inducible protein OsmY